MTDPAPQKRPTWVLALGVLAAVGLLGLVARKGIGARTASETGETSQGSVSTAEAEGRSGTTQLARGIASCVADQKDLPPTAPPVPAALAMVSGKKYLSAGTDWDAPAYQCARFGMTAPQHYRYQWIRTNAKEGTVLGEADLDGDGKVDDTISVYLTCEARGAGLACTVGFPFLVGPRPAPS